MINQSIKRFFNFFCHVIVVVLICDALLLLFFSSYQPELKKTDSIIVLGAAINSPALINRTKHALGLYNQDLADRIILSGGKISEADISEAGFMQKVINKQTNSKPSVLIEDKASSTYENIKFSHQASPETKGIIIVSDRFHLARATMLALRNGLWPVYWSSPEESPYTNKELAWYYAREFVAILAYIPRFIFN